MMIAQDSWLLMFLPTSIGFVNAVNMTRSTKAKYIDLVFVL